MEKIEIIDNFFEEGDIEKMYEFILKNKWTIQASNRNSVTDFLMCNVSDENFFNTYLFNKIKKKLNINYNIERIYFNGQWCGREGDFHPDDTKKTLLIYISDYQFGWGGFTEFFISEKEQVIVHPIKNRAVIFDGNILHKGYSFSFQECPMRVSLAYKLI
jgi:hypothetical protein